MLLNFEQIFPLKAENGKINVCTVCDMAISNLPCLETPSFVCRKINIHFRTGARNSNQKLRINQSSVILM